MTVQVRSPIRVAAGILRDAAGNILLAQRPAVGELAGLWEFPGGKLEPGESVEGALARELHEELGIDVRSARPFRSVHWTYRERDIELIVCEVDAYTGQPHGRENQALRWLAPRALLETPMPAADRPIAVALNLPPLCLVTPEPAADFSPFLDRLDTVLRGGIRLVQLRAKTLEMAPLRELAKAVRDLTARRAALALLNGHCDLAQELGYDGVHLPARDVARLSSRPVPPSMLLGASCHNEEQCARGQAIAADFLMLAPVRSTATHPTAAALGWDGFAAMVRATPLPCYALGGLDLADLAVAKTHGGIGIAAIRALW